VLGSVDGRILLQGLIEQAAMLTLRDRSSV